MREFDRNTPRAFRRRPDESAAGHWRRCVAMLARELRSADPDTVRNRLAYLTGPASGYAMGGSFDRLRADVSDAIRGL